MTQFKYFALLILSLFIFSGCQETSYSEGEINYVISYPKYNQKEKQLMYAMLPKEQKFVFKDNAFKSVISKGLMEISMNVDTEKEDVSMFFNFNQGNFSHLNVADKKVMLDNLSEYSIELKDETKKIAGLDAKKAIAKNAAGEEIEIWYTNQIAISNPNWFNPFDEVPGFLLQYSVDYYGLHMCFTAENFEQRTVTSEELSVTSKDNEVEYSKMIELLESSLKEYK